MRIGSAWLDFEAAREIGGASAGDFHIGKASRAAGSGRGIATINGE